MHWNLEISFYFFSLIPFNLKSQSSLQCVSFHLMKFQIEQMMNFDFFVSFQSIFVFFFRFYCQRWNSESWCMSLYHLIDEIKCINNMLVYWTGYDDVLHRSLSFIKFYFFKFQLKLLELPIEAALEGEI